MEQWLSQRLLTPPFNFGQHSHPSHPLDAYLRNTQEVHSKAMGCFVYLVDFGAVNYPNYPTFSVNSGAVPRGSIFLAVLTDSGSLNVNVDTPNSASILETGVGTPVPEPNSLMLVGSGLLGAFGLLRRRQTRKAVFND